MHALDPCSPIAIPPLQPPAQMLALPGCDRPLAYAAHYWPATVLNLLRPHRLRGDVARPRLAAPVSIPDALRRDWQALFDADAQCPLLVNQSVGTLLYTRLFRQLGLNFRRLLHVQHRTEHQVAPAALAGAARQLLVSELRGCWRLGADKALVVLGTQVLRPVAEGGGLLARVEDGFLIRAVPPADWARLPPLEDGEQLRELQGLRKRRALIAGPRLPLPLAPDLGRRYGRVSGDHNPVHTTPLAARLFGQPRPFAQGLALRNLVAAALHRQGLPLAGLRLCFAQPAYLGQTLGLVVQDGQFELQDADARVVAFGSVHLHL